MQAILTEFNKEQEAFIKSKQKGCDGALAPWAGYPDEEALKAEILSLSTVTRAIPKLVPPPRANCCTSRRTDAISFEARPPASSLTSITTPTTPSPWQYSLKIPTCNKCASTSFPSCNIKDSPFTQPNTRTTFVLGSKKNSSGATTSTEWVSSNSRRNFQPWLKAVEIEIQQICRGILVTMKTKPVSNWKPSHKPKVINSVWIAEGADTPDSPMNEFVSDSFQNQTATKDLKDVQEGIKRLGTKKQNGISLFSDM